MAAQAPEGDGEIDVSVGLRTRIENWRWFPADAEHEYTYSGSLLRTGITQRRSWIGWQVEMAVPVLLGLPRDAAAPPPQGQAGTGPAYYAASGEHEHVVSAFLKQGYVRLGRAPGTAGHGLRLGRFEFAEGTERTPADATLAAVKRDRVAHRLLGNFGWSHVGRSLDGAHYAYTRPRVNVTAVAARPTQGVFDVDGWPGLDVGVAYAAVTVPREDERYPGEGRLFGLLYVDYRDDAASLKVDNRPPSVRGADEDDVTIATFGGHYLRGILTPGGMIDVLLWAAFQAGEWGAQSHRAWAAAAELGVQPHILPLLRPWFRLGWSRGSGDNDPDDGDHHTFFQVLPTPRLYARVPFYNMMNTQEVFGSLILRPDSRLSLRGDVRGLWLAQSRDLWYSGGGAFEPESFGFGGRPSGGLDRLGVLADGSVEIRLTDRLSGSIYAGWVQGGQVVKQIHPEGTSARFGYVELEYRP